MHVVIFHDPAAFDELSVEWAELLGRVGGTESFVEGSVPDASISGSLFLTPEFQKVWWKHYGESDSQKKLILMTVRDDAEKLVGIFPFFSVIENENSTQLSKIQLLGNREVSDYLDLIVDYKLRQEVYKGLVNFLKNFEWTKLQLLSIPEKSQTLSEVLQLMKEAGWQTEIQEQNVCPVISLPKTWEEYLAFIGKKQRHEIKRKWRNLEDAVQPKFVVIETAENIEKDTTDFIHLNQLSSAAKAAFWTPAEEKYFFDLIQVCAGRGWLKLYFLEVQNERVATMLCFDYQNQFFLYNSGFDPSKFAGLSVGNVLTSFTIKHAIELGRSRYDFLRGNEEYKLRFGAVAEKIFDVTIKKN